MKVCSSCGAECGNCGEIYDAAFCPVCGVEAGNDGKLCPKCDKKYFGKSCPDCGYREGMENANKVYTPTAAANPSGENNTEKKYDLSGKGYSAQELLLADMAMNKKNGGPSAVDLGLMMPKKSSCKKSTALILCLLFGWMGAHQYYVGNSKKGMLYVMTMGLFFVGVLMDAVAIYQGDFKDSKGLPLS